MNDFSLLQELCSIHAPSGNEYNLTQFIISYIEKKSFTWKRKPKIYYGSRLQDCIILAFGCPQTAIYAHIDSVGYTAGHHKKLIPIGSPRARKGTELVGKDSQGDILCTLDATKNADDKLVLSYNFEREIDPGTSLTFKPHFEETETHISANQLDNRVGVWTALKIAEKLRNGIIVFSCYEEHGGGTVPFLQRFINKRYRIKQALIADITWITEDVLDGKGCAISARDSLIPRRQYVERIIDIARRSGIPYQIEVEQSGGSDGSSLQLSEYAIDWCFVGAPQYNPHEPIEKINKSDINSMLNLYSVLMKEL
jgi:putative aminopeptidase FrvX